MTVSETMSHGSQPCQAGTHAICPYPLIIKIQDFA